MIQGYGLSSGCERWWRGPRRYRGTNFCVCRIYSTVLEVPELVNSDSNPRPWGHKTHILTHTLSTPLRPPVGIPWSPECVHLLYLFTFSLIIPTWPAVNSLFHLHVVFALHSHLKCFFFSVISCSLLFLSLTLTLFLSLSLFLAMNHPPTHPSNPSIHPSRKHVGIQTPFLESKTTRGIWLEYGNT